MKTSLIMEERTRLRLEADTEDHRQARLDLQLAKVRLGTESLEYVHNWALVDYRDWRKRAE